MGLFKRIRAEEQRRLMKTVQEQQRQRMKQCIGAVEVLSPTDAFSLLANMVAALSYNVSDREWTLALERAKEGLSLLTQSAPPAAPPLPN